MSFAEILDQLPRLTATEREELATRLKTLDRVQDRAFLDEMDRRIDRMEAGEIVISEDLAATLRERREHA